MYHSIEPDRGFRVLILQPAINFEADIKCNLISADINNYPKYEALSYVWGNDPTRRPVVVNDEQIMVTVNLERALRYLRLPQESRSLWVDAICIDQTNTLERSNHVRYMKEIYARCSSDLLWLGEDNTIVKNALKVMEKYETLVILDDNLDDVKDEEMEDLEQLFSVPPAWQRVWIMQEISYAPNVQLVAGHTSMPWEVLEYFLGTDKYIEQNGMPDLYHAPFGHGYSRRRDFNSTLVYPHLLAQQRRGIQKSDHNKFFASPLVDVLARFRFTHATDERDKVYALLGLAADNLNVPVDYTRSVKEVYTQVATTLIAAAGNLDLICQGPWQLNDRVQTEDGLPSWVPNFRDPGESLVLFAQRGIFKATGDDTRFELNVELNSVLRLKGYQLDTLSTVRQSFWDSYKTDLGTNAPDLLPTIKNMLLWMPNIHLEEGVRKGNHALEIFLDAADLSSPAQTSSRTLSYESYWRTLMLDCLNTPTRRIDPVAEMPRLRELFLNLLTTPLARQTDENFYQAHDLLNRACGKWSFALSKYGSYCMVPPGSQSGDVLVLARGAKTPIVLRPTPGRKNDYLWVGACYVHGFMDGEGFGIDATSRTETAFDVV